MGDLESITVELCGVELMCLLCQSGTQCFQGGLREGGGGGGERERGQMSPQEGRFLFTLLVRLVCARDSSSSLTLLLDKNNYICHQY